MTFLSLAACRYSMTESCKYLRRLYLLRLLTEDDCALLGRPSAFTPGTSLIQVAVRFQSEDVLALLLTSGTPLLLLKPKPFYYPLFNFCIFCFRNGSQNRENAETYLLLHFCLRFFNFSFRNGGSNHQENAVSYLAGHCRGYSQTRLDDIKVTIKFKREGLRQATNVLPL